MRLQLQTTLLLAARTMLVQVIHTQLPEEAIKLQSIVTPRQEAVIPIQHQIPITIQLPQQTMLLLTTLPEAVTHPHLLMLHHHLIQLQAVLITRQVMDTPARVMEHPHTELLLITRHPMERQVMELLLMGPHRMELQAMERLTIQLHLCRVFLILIPDYYRMFGASLSVGKFLNFPLLNLV